MSDTAPKTPTGKCTRCQGKGYGDWRIMDGQCLLCDGTGLRGMTDVQAKWWMQTCRQLMNASKPVYKMLDGVDNAGWDAAWVAANAKYAPGVDRLVRLAATALERVGGKVDWEPNAEYPYATWDVPTKAEFGVRLLKRAAIRIYNATVPAESMKDVPF